MDPSDVASKVYSEAVVVDGLNVSNWESPAVFDSLSNGGVTAINATIAVWEGYAEAMDNVAAWVRRFEERRANLSQVTGVQDILDSKRSGKTGVILGWQNASPIENDLFP